MKYLLIAISALALTNCNTLIGVGRDTQQGFEWCNRKFQESRNGGGGGQYDSAPIY